MGVQDNYPTTETAAVHEFDTVSYTEDAPTKRSWKPTLNRDRLFSRDFWIGDYDYLYLFYPNLPGIPNPYKHQPQPFFGVEQNLPVMLAALLGFQHGKRLHDSITDRSSGNACRNRDATHHLGGCRAF